MFNDPSTLRIAVYGSDRANSGRGVGLWPAGYRGALIAAGAQPVLLEPSAGDESWGHLLSGVQGVVVCGFYGDSKQGDVESLCLWAKNRRLPLLAIDKGMLAMNAAFGGVNFTDLPREMPEALQHRHPPEHGLRHAIMVHEGTKLCDIYGEGEVVVNSEHRTAVQKPANGFQVGGSALDGVIEAIEYKGDWFAMGVQWQPASGTASGLDIQIFRALVDASSQPVQKTVGRRPRMAMAG